MPASLPTKAQESLGRFLGSRQPPGADCGCTGFAESPGASSVFGANHGVNICNTQMTEIAVKPIEVIVILTMDLTLSFSASVHSSLSISYP